MSFEKYDLVVLGSGPAGEKGAAAAAYYGKKVALIEKENVLGGAAANTGTLPSKTLRESALYLSGFKQRKLFGFQVDMKKTIHISDFMAHERFVTDNERQRIRENLAKHDITVYRGMSSFLDLETVVVRPDRCPEIYLKASRFLIATGSYPFRPKNFPFHDPRVLDSDTILALDIIPESMVVIGGGVIGCEYACMFAALGVNVCVVEKAERIVGGMDSEISSSLKLRMESSGIKFYMSDSVKNIECGKTVDVELESGAIIQTHSVLVSSGRSGQTGSLGLENVDIPTNSRGHILVNEHFQTKQPHIYAAGDVIGNPSLASSAMAQGRIAAYHAFGLKQAVHFPSLLPSGLYTIPECSSAGQSEEQLNEAGIPYFEGKASYANNARGQIIGDTEGFLKLLFHRDTKKLLGVHVIGEGATEIVHIGLTVMVMDGGVDVFIDTCYNYPTISEIYKYACYDALGKLDKINKSLKESADY